MIKTSAMDFSTYQIIKTSAMDFFFISDDQYICNGLFLPQQIRKPEVPDNSIYKSHHINFKKIDNTIFIQLWENICKILSGLIYWQ
jgi:hypothetical protein